MKKENETNQDFHERICKEGEQERKDFQNSTQPCYRCHKDILPGELKIRYVYNIPEAKGDYTKCLCKECGEWDATQITYKVKQLEDELKKVKSESEGRIRSLEKELKYEKRGIKLLGFKFRIDRL